MAAIEFGRDLDGQAHLGPSLLHLFTLGNRADKITAKTDEGPHLPRQESLTSFDRIHALLARRLEAELRGEFVQRNFFRLFGDADGPLPLHVRVASHGRNTRPFAPDIALEQHQVDQHRDVFEAVHLLGQTHAVESSHALCLDIDLRGAFDRGASQSRTPARSGSTQAPEPWLRTPQSHLCAV